MHIIFKGALSLRKGCSFALIPIILAGCQSSHERERQCGTPCPHISPKPLAEASLIEAYRASALGRDLSPPAQIAASRALQDLLVTGDDRHDSRWFVPSHSGRNKLPRGRFSLIQAGHEKGVACITYRQEIIFPEKKRISHGKACRDRAGVWRIIEEFPYAIR